MLDKAEHKELNWVIVWAVVIVLLSSVPYLWGVFITPPGYTFTGLTHNIDDGAVYLSWMRQAADGHFFQRNLFTSDPQPARQFNVLFLVMGWCAAITHLPLFAVYHLFRIVSGIVLILGIWQFSRLFLTNERQRKVLVLLVGFSSGFGWLIPAAKAPTGSVDLWQPEAITFLSVYLNPLFLIGLLLMIGSLYWLELSRREASVKYAIYAGLHLLALGNVHTYDVLTVACVWTVYIIALWIQSKAFPTKIVLLSLLTAVVATPSVAYQFWVYALDPIYRARANTPIHSPPVISFILGYGLVLFGAIAGAILWKKQKINKPPAAWLLFSWGIVGFVIPYIPIAQQRKLVMGLHIPLCILCAYALSYLASRVPARLGRIALAAFLILAAPTNIKFLATDMILLTEGKTVTHYAPDLSKSQLAAMDYLRAKATPGDTIFAPPVFALFVPAYTGAHVYYGHWSETPDYSDKLASWAALSDFTISDYCWIDIINEAIPRGYYVSESAEFDPRPALSKRFIKCFESGEVRIYRYVGEGASTNK